ncbi:anaphase promoting complex subunit DOC1, partial [Ascoidea rubescens DSM 1968]
EQEGYLVGLRRLEAQGLIDIGNLAYWKVSSFKLGCGIAQLREDSPDTFWQSDGTQPHFITIHFSKKVALKQISIYTDFNLDESYTPSSIMVLAGHGLHDLKEVTSITMREPKGWNHIKFDDLREDGLLKCFFLKILVVSNHQNGKDTHIRSVKTF